MALPWVNDYSGNIQNKAEHIVDDAVQNRSHYEWSEDTTGLSWQPYLLYITKKICEAVGYAADFSKCKAVEEYKYLLICIIATISLIIPISLISSSPRRRGGGGAFYILLKGE